MPMRMSKTDLRKAARSAESLRTRMKNLRKKSEKVTESIVHTAEISTAAFAMGFTQGRFNGGIEVVGVPLELLLGSALNLGAWMGLGGKHATHLHGIGNGCLAAYFTTLGRGVGQSTGGAAVSGLPAGARGTLGARGGGFTDDELEAMALAAAG